MGLFLRVGLFFEGGSIFEGGSTFKGNKRVYVLGLEPAKWLVYLYGLVVCMDYFWAFSHNAQRRLKEGA